MDRVRASPTGVFTYVDATRAWRRAAANTSTGVLLPRVATGCFFPGRPGCSLPAVGDRWLLYKTLRVAEVGDALGADVPTVAGLISGASPALHVWLGQAGVVATTHYGA